MMNNVTNPHDKLFRDTWSNKENAQDFLMHYLPQSVLEMINLDTLEISKDSFVDQNLREYFSDILYKVNLIEIGLGYVYLMFEHKSYTDRWVQLQLLEYMLKIWRLHLKQHKEKETEQLPIIIPMILYHGRSQWPVPVRFSGLFAGPKDALAVYIPDFEYILYDLSRYSDDEMKGTVLSRVVMLLFKHIFDSDIEQHLPQIFSLMRDLVKGESGLHYLETLLRYIFSATESITIDQVKTIADQSLSVSEGDVIMTLAEQLEKKGYNRGIQEGIRKGLLEGIELGISLKFGEEGLALMPFIQTIYNVEHLKVIKDAIKTVQDLSELKTIILSHS